jgi:hypothetical protein
VSGTWFTRHSFRLGPLPFAIRAAFDSLRGLDQLLAGALGLPSWAESIVRSVMHHFVPASFRTLVRIGDDLGTVLSTMRSEGTMQLRPGIDAAHLRATEEWTALYFSWLPLCGDAIDAGFELPPECARIDVLSGEAGDGSERMGSCPFPKVSVEAAPFDAAVERAGSGWRMSVPSRRIRVRIDQVALAAIDVLLGAATPWRCVEEATDCTDGKTCAIDCSGLGSWTHRLTGIVPASAVEAGCASTVAAAGRAAGKLLGEIAFASDTLDFGGSATISRVGADESCESGTSCAGQLGNDAFDRDLRLNPAARDGSWQGAFFDPLARDLPGAWEARRSPFP